MAQNGNEQKQTQPVPKKGMTNFRKALLWTAIPIIVVCAIDGGSTIAKNGLFYGALVPTVLWGLAILVCIGFAIAKKRQIALGILAGIGIGLVGLVLTYIGELYMS